jgi:glutaredoxin-related protein
MFLGGAQNVRCGFSRAMVGLLQEEGIAFDSFDILSDNQVRVRVLSVCDAVAVRARLIDRW